MVTLSVLVHPKELKPNILMDSFYQLKLKESIITNSNFTYKNFRLQKK
jgi:hypothetical protein